MMTIKLPEDVEQQISELARGAGQSEAAYVLNVLLKHLEDMEDMLIAEARLEDLRAGRSRTIPLDEVMSEYGLEG
jgi:RHH-type transcriptional regulator, rel operon repressor / antitoxin RelB